MNHKGFSRLGCFDHDLGAFGVVSIGGKRKVVSIEIAAHVFAVTNQFKLDTFMGIGWGIREFCHVIFTISILNRLMVPGITVMTGG